MYEYYFTFRSMTGAQKAMLALRDHGIPSVFLRAPKRISDLGCGYAVKLPAEDGRSAAAVLRREDISYERWVRVFPDGSVEEARF